MIGLAARNLFHLIVTESLMTSLPAGASGSLGGFALEGPGNDWGQTGIAFEASMA
jgi:hypothetical protein